MRVFAFWGFLAVGILALVPCTFSRSYNAVVNLPEDTSPETAQHIITIVLRDNFRQKIKAEFPYLTEKQLNGLSIYWRLLRMMGDEKSTLSIIIRMQYGGELTQGNAKATAEYGKTVVEKAVKNYFQMQQDEPIQQASLFTNARCVEDYVDE